MAFALQPLRAEDAMARRKQESGDERQQRIQREQHRPEQNRGYDEAARGGETVAHDRPDRMVPVSGDESQLQNTTEDIDDQEAARLAREDVRRRGDPASRSGRREP
jgi:hypothetical protein